MKDQDVERDVAELLRTRLALKLTESDLASLIGDVVNTVIKATATTTSEDKCAEDKCAEDKCVEDKLNKLKDYIDYKCREIERSLSDHHVRPRERDRRERMFRDRSRSPFPLRGTSAMFGGLALNPVSSPLIYTRTPAAFFSRNPLFDSYFS
jgi:hypothetical protein